MNLDFIHGIVFALLLIHNSSAFFTKRILLDLADTESPSDPFAKCIHENHSVAICCWRFPEIEDCPSDDDDDDESIEGQKNNGKMNSNLVEEFGKDWLKQYGDEFFS